MSIDTLLLLAQENVDPATIIGIVIAGVILLAILIFFFVFMSYFQLWIQAYLANADVTLLDLLGMTFRGVNRTVIVRSKIMAVQAGIDEPELSTKALEAHYLSGGNVPMIIQSLIAANKAKIIKLTYREATAIDLAGRDVLDAVKTSVYPKVIDCPGRTSDKDFLAAVAKNGIVLKVKARVTVRANLQQLIGGATEETIIARVGEGIVSAIGSAEDHAHVLENPDLISKAVLARKLDSQTAFEIVSIDIADIDVGENIGARLQADQAEADTRVAQARAEGKRAQAIAEEQENYAAIEESRAKVIDAESQVPRAIAQAFNTGKLGIVEYFKLRNVQADTDMRKSLAGPGAAASRT
jgi:uncharacterized protein YqfA (UPF0365 family)